MSYLKVFKSTSEATCYAFNSRIDYDVISLEKELLKNSACKMNDTLFLVDEQGILN